MSSVQDIKRLLEMLFVRNLLNYRQIIKLQKNVCTLKVFYYRVIKYLGLYLLNALILT